MKVSLMDVDLSVQFAFEVLDLYHLKDIQVGCSNSQQFEKQNPHRYKCLWIK